MEQRKIKLGILVTDILAIVFMIVGGTFSGVSIVTYLYRNQIRAVGNGDVSVLPVVFGSIGIPLFLLGVLCLILSVRKRKRINRIVQQGVSVMATVTDVRRNYSVQVNGFYPYVVECHYQDPATGTVHVFHSRNLYYYPEELMNQEIRVYVEQGHMSHYYVDTESRINVQIH